MSVNRIKGLVTAVFAIAAGALLVAASKPLPPSNPGGQNWNATVQRTDHDSYLLGDPEAPLKLVEYISYTCPHCAHFEMESEAPLRIGMVAKGTGSIEVRPFIRNNIDLTVALLAECGDPSQFFMNNAYFLHQQANWITPMVNASPMDIQRWQSGDFVSRNRHIADDFGFYTMMRDRGYERPQVDKCLANEALGKRLMDETAAAEKDPGVQATPSFMINGILLAGTYDWDSLRPQIDARLDEINGVDTNN